MKKKENSLVFEEIDFSDGDVNLSTAELVASSRNKASKMNPILDLGVGLRWEETWCCDRFRTALDLGWEHHIWFDYNRRNQSFGAETHDDEIDQEQVFYVTFSQYNQVTSNFGYGGLVVRARFDF